MSGARLPSLTVEDVKGRAPTDLLSSKLRSIHVATVRKGTLNTEVISFGSGANYALGTGSVDPQCDPAYVEALHGQGILMVCCWPCSPEGLPPPP